MRLGHDVRLVPADLREAVREAAEERRGGRGGDLRGGAAPDHALCGGEGGRATGKGDAVPHARSSGAPAHAGRSTRSVGHLAEFGVVAPQGVAHVGRLALALEDPGSGLPGAVRALGGVLLGQIADLDSKIDGLEKELRACARQDEDAARLMTIPGIGPISAMALQAFAPPMESFRRGRDFSAWLGLVPRQHKTGGKPRPGRISKMGQRDLRRLLIIGAMAVVSSAVRRGETNDPWLARMLARKPRMLVAVALANKMARIVWALMTRKETYRGFRAGCCLDTAATSRNDVGGVSRSEDG